MLKFLAPLLAIFFSASSERKASDGYHFGRETWVSTDLRVKVVLLPSMKELRAIGPKLPHGQRLFAFSEIRPNGHCTIYKVDSRVEYRPERDGHEFNHCIYGEWHRKQNK